MTVPGFGSCFDFAPRQVGGHHVFGLARVNEAWRITRMKLETLQQSGNVKLLQEVQAAR